ncbi:hypothetical protein EDB19DRAFT_1826261 [Suillus lakei]|nr:hypothetical protein EDB19DRAFT_1826261 [Suillus lakei]
MQHHTLRFFLNNWKENELAKNVYSAWVKGVKPEELNQDDPGFYTGEDEDRDNVKKKRSASKDTHPMKRHKPLSSLSSNLKQKNQNILQISSHPSQIEHFYHDTTMKLKPAQLLWYLKLLSKIYSLISTGTGTAVSQSDTHVQEPANKPPNLKALVATITPATIMHISNLDDKPTPPTSNVPLNTSIVQPVEAPKKGSGKTHASSKKNGRDLCLLCWLKQVRTDGSSLELHMYWNALDQQQHNSYDSEAKELASASHIVSSYTDLTLGSVFLEDLGQEHRNVLYFVVATSNMMWGTIFGEFGRLSVYIDILGLPLEVASFQILQRKAESSTNNPDIILWCLYYYNETKVTAVVGPKNFLLSFKKTLFFNDDDISSPDAYDQVKIQSILSASLKISSIFDDENEDEDSMCITTPAVVPTILVPTAPSFPPVATGTLIPVPTAPSIPPVATGMLIPIPTAPSIPPVATGMLIPIPTAPYIPPIATGMLIPSSKAISVVCLTNMNASTVAPSYASNTYHTAVVAFISIWWRLEKMPFYAPFKMAWPMAIINVSLESMKDDYLATTVKLDAENHYQSFPDNMWVLTLNMRGAAHLSESKKLAPGVEFIQHNIHAGFPPNIFIIINTHSNKFTTMLQHTGGHSGGTSTSIKEIMTAYLGQEFQSAMKAVSTAARSDESIRKTVNGNDVWCDLTACARGGWKGLFMVSCGPAIRVSHHFEEVKGMVQNVFSHSDIWPALCEMLASSNDILDYTTVVVMFVNTIKGQRILECCQISKDIPGVRAFGYEFKSCGTLRMSSNASGHACVQSQQRDRFSSMLEMPVEATSSHTGKGKKGVDKKTGKRQDIACRHQARFRDGAI